MKKYFVINGRGEAIEIKKPNVLRALGYTVIAVEGIRKRVLKAFKS